MYVILAEKMDQAINYYKALTLNSNPIQEKIFRGKGYIEIFNPEYFNGQKAIITWAIGHLTELQEPEDYKDEWREWSLESLPIVPEKFEYRISSQTNASRQYEIVKNLLQRATTIVWAGDIDREGCHVSYSICCLAGVWNKPGIQYKSLWIDELAPKAIQKGFKNLQPIDLRYNMALEAQARAYADWLIGMNASRLLTLLLRDKLGLSLGKNQGKIAAGRIISVVASFIYQREKEIENFVPRTYYKLEATFQHQNGTYIGKYIPANIVLTKGPNKGEKWRGEFDSPKQWEIFINNPKYIGEVSSGKIISKDISMKYSRSPRLFSLGDLQKHMNSVLGMDPDQVLEIAEELYDKDKVTTYPRTSSNHIGVERYESLIETSHIMADFLGISKNLINIPDKKDGYFVNNKKSAVHAALTTTDTFPKIEQYNSWSSEKKAIYTEIMKRSLAMFLPKYSYEQTTIITEVGAGLFKTIGDVPKEPGWKLLWKDENALIDKDDLDAKQLIPVQENDTVKPILNPIGKTTSSPPLYTLGTLLEAMETAGRKLEDEELQQIMKEAEGLGTEATRANILKHIIEYGWTVTKKGKVYLTPLGRLICESIEGEKLLSNAETTARWEQSLRKIGQKTNTQEKFLSNIMRYLGVDSPEHNIFVTLPKWIDNVDFNDYKDWLADLAKKRTGEIGECPKCGGSVKYRTFEKNKKKMATMSCENSWVPQDSDQQTPTCDFSVFLSIAGKILTAKDAETLLSKGQTRVVKGFKGQKAVFDARVTWDTDKLKNENVYTTKFLFEVKEKK